MSIPDQLALCEEMAEQIAVSNAILAMMMPRVRAAAVAGVLSEEQGERFIGLTDRLKYLRSVGIGGLK
jgi:hypothetical protein